MAHHELLTLCGVVAALAGSAACTPARSQAPVSFTALLAHHMDVPGAAPRLAIRETRAVRADGSHVREYELFPSLGIPPYKQRVVSFRDGRVVTIWEHLKVRSTYRPGFRAFGPEPSRDCLAFADGQPFGEIKAWSRETVQGYEAVKVAFELANAPERQPVLWMVPELHCLAVQQGYSEKGVAATSGMKLVNLQKGEPATTLFDSADYFEEVAPSEGHRRVDDFKRRANPLCCPKPFDASRYTASDQSYWAKRP